MVFPSVCDSGSTCSVLEGDRKWARRRLLSLLAEVFEERLHGVVVGLRQLLHQLFDGLNSVAVVWNLCGGEDVNNLRFPPGAATTN